MKNSNHLALLPAGMSDVLSPDSAFETELLDSLIKAFSAYGYEKVTPPLIEFEDGLLGGIGEAMEAQTFRLMDPISQRMMGVRADMTPQIARIAATRLKSIPRPLRISYAGQVLRVKGTEIRPERQFYQVGAELIGAESLTADVEVIVMAVNSLKKIGLNKLSIDLGLPKLIPIICGELNFDNIFQTKLRAILDRKDIATTNSLKNELGEEKTKIFTQLLECAGPLDKSLLILNDLQIGKRSSEEIRLVANVAKYIQKAIPELRITIDPVENRGFEYHSGVTFNLFSTDVSGEIGTGGRYLAKYGDSNPEESTGFTLFMDIILKALPKPATRSKIFIPFKTLPSVAEQLQSDGWVTIAGLVSVTNNRLEAKRLGCTYIFEDHKINQI